MFPDQIWTLPLSTGVFKGNNWIFGPHLTPKILEFHPQPALDWSQAHVDLAGILSLEHHPVAAPIKAADSPCLSSRGPRGFYRQSRFLHLFRFFRDYLLPNHPCIFSAKFTQDWGSRKTWVTPEGKPNFEHLLKEFGEAVVPVANCDIREYNSNPKERLPFKEFLEYWREYIGNGHRSSRGCLYLKDWHLSRDFPEQDVYTTPVYFSSDWLNEYWDAVAVDDFRFVYMGPKGSCRNSIIHLKFLMEFWDQYLDKEHLIAKIPSSNQDSMRNFAIGMDTLAFYKIKFHNPTKIPHGILGSEDTISINHNWVNGCNVAVMWCFLQDELAAVQREISQWKDPWMIGTSNARLECWSERWKTLGARELGMFTWRRENSRERPPSPFQSLEKLQRSWRGIWDKLIMKSCTGIDYKEFYNFLKVVAENRVSILEKGLDEESSSQNNSKAAISTLGMLHAVFDLKRTVKVLSSLSANEDFRKLDLASLSPPPEVLLQHLESAIDTALL
ncbi:hypothetical protein DUI87_17795 [Hirundo rustica rustica]|uniref:Uncharacterized protein n=1 Tax=Hirundo rustica rustica TaxID=333673 RepID=A0A3M0JUN2_HIRRU|nr:hypothetical protein DUI87_17795 [Hirundo rustica rustica]